MQWANRKISDCTLLLDLHVSNPDSTPTLYLFNTDLPAFVGDLCILLAVDLALYRAPNSFASAVFAADLLALKLCGTDETRASTTTILGQNRL